MKKRIFALLLFVAMALTVPAYASSARTALIQPGLSFSGTQANCSLLVFGDYGTEKISATVKLKNGNTNIKTWNVSVTGDLIFSETVIVEKGKSYTLYADVTIDGKVYPTATISRTNN